MFSGHLNEQTAGLTFPGAVLRIDVSLERRLVFLRDLVCLEELGERRREAGDGVGRPAVRRVLHDGVEDVAAPVARRQRLRA